MYTPIYKLDYKLRESSVHGEPRQCPAFQTSKPYRSSLRDDPLTVFGLEKKEPAPFSSKRNYTERGLRRCRVMLLDGNQDSSLLCCTSRSSFCACSKSAKRCSSSARKISACS